MRIGMIGLGRMGGNMARRLMRTGHEVVAYDHGPDSVKKLAAEGAFPAFSLDELRDKLAPPRHAWVMVPAGNPTEQTVCDLRDRFEKDDVVIDGGNSFYKDDVRRSKTLCEKGIHYVDVGTSGGVWGAERGYCLMIGGAKVAIDRLDPVFKSLAPGKGNAEPTPGREKFPGTADAGYLHCGPAGAGHFVKMVHNGIEYGLMQAYGEGFNLFKQANAAELPDEFRYDLNLADIAEVWRRGSVVGSWLLDLSAIALLEDPNLEGYSGRVEDSGEGRWTVQRAIEQGTPLEVLTSALYTRFRSRIEHSFGEQMLSAMRKQFGGHIEVHPAVKAGVEETRPENTGNTDERPK